MADQQELARDLGFLEAYTIGLGTMIGAGIFVLPSIAAANAGPASMVSFLIGGIVSLLAALSLSELATGMPRAGGSYYYVNQALGGFFGSIVGWGMWSGLMFASAFYMLGFAQYMTYFYGNLPVVATALVMSIFLIYINYRGTKETATFQNFIVLALVGIIIVFIVFGIMQINLQILKPFNPKGWGAVAATAATVYVSFIGFEVIATSAEEIKEPGRNLPLSMVASVLTPTVMYVLVMFVSTGILPIPTLVESNIPVAQVADVVMGATGSFIMVVGAILATVSSANASILSAARVNFAMGRDRLLSNWLNEIHNQYRTPYRSILVTGLVILGLIALGVGIETLANVASFMYLLTYALVHLAVVVMRRADQEEYQPDFRLPNYLYPVVPVLGFIACVVILIQMQSLVVLVGSFITLFGAGWYLLYAKRHTRGEHLIGEAIANPASQVQVMNSVYRIVVPVANPSTERYLLQLASASARAHEHGEIVAVNVIEVPDQTALRQDIVFEEQRIKRQQEILDTAREFSEELNIGLRTRAILGRDVGEDILNVLDDEDADQVLLGWRGVRQPREYILGSNIDPIVKRAPCEVTLVKLGGQTIGSVVALCGEGPHAPVAAKRGYEFSQSDPNSSLTLLRVEPPHNNNSSPEEQGQEVIQKVAERAGLQPDDFEARVLVQEDVRGTLLSCVNNYDIVCVGATRGGTMEQALFGSIPEQIGEETNATVAMVRGERTKPRSILEAIMERLES